MSYLFGGYLDYMICRPLPDFIFIFADWYKKKPSLLRADSEFQCVV